MTANPPHRSYVGDPLLFAIEKGYPLTAYVLDQAIAHRELRMRHTEHFFSNSNLPSARALRGYHDEWAAEITALKIARKRLLIRDLT